MWLVRLSLLRARFPRSSYRPIPANPTDVSMLHTPTTLPLRPLLLFYLPVDPTLLLAPGPARVLTKRNLMIFTFLTSSSAEEPPLCFFSASHGSEKKEHKIVKSLTPPASLLLRLPPLFSSSS